MSMLIMIRKIRWENGKCQFICEKELFCCLTNRGGGPRGGRVCAGKKLTGNECNNSNGLDMNAWVCESPAVGMEGTDRRLLLKSKRLFNSLQFVNDSHSLLNILYVLK